MIVLNVTYRCKQGAREEFLERIRRAGIDTACRAEEGNLKYDYYLPTDGENELLLVEKWTDAASLASHGQQPHIAQLKALKEAYVTETVIERFDDR